jgi:putative CocE/NonD family hydrolase
MTLATRIVALLAGLPKERVRPVRVERALSVSMPDGIRLLADRYYPASLQTAPLVLIRTPYGRGGWDALVAQLLAERGYQCILQSVRGTFGSGGEFVPFQHEAEDGRATLEWIAGQPWFSGKLAMCGGSYLGLTQWAIADDQSGYLKALAPHKSTSRMRTGIYPGGAFALESALNWVLTICMQEQAWWQVAWVEAMRQVILAPAFAHMPLHTVDGLVCGRTIDYFQDWLTHTSEDDAYWTAVDFSANTATLCTPVNLVGGWYDVFLSSQLDDYRTLRRAGNRVRLTIGPWTHLSPWMKRKSLAESVAWFDACMRDNPAATTGGPVRIFLMGANSWRDLPDWPPPAKASRWYLNPAGAFGPTPGSDNGSDQFIYDPTQPTPSVGGAILGLHAGTKDNRALEARSDVLVYSSEPLQHALDVIGEAELEVWFRSTLTNTDVFARLCDVSPAGRSTNVCDGLVRLGSAISESIRDGRQLVHVKLSPTAYRFRRGHRLCLQISSGAHPRYSRNPGTGEALGAATSLRSAHQSVHHGPDYPSALTLPIFAS